MFKLNMKLMAGGVLCAVLLAGCGGGGDSNGSGLGALTPPPNGGMQTITAVADFIKHLIASAGENSDPIDINSLTLAADDSAEPAAVE